MLVFLVDIELMPKNKHEGSKIKLRVILGLETKSARAISTSRGHQSALITPGSHRFIVLVMVGGSRRNSS